MKIKKKFVCLFLLLLCLCLAAACGNAEGDADAAQEAQLPEMLPVGEEEAPALNTEENEKEETSPEEIFSEEAASEESLAEEAPSFVSQQEQAAMDTPTVAVESPAASSPETGSPENTADEPAANSYPEPVEPDTVSISDVAQTCYMSISCATVLDNMELLDPEKAELIPSDGVLFARKEVTFYEGESVFNVLQRELKQAGIQMEHSTTPVYNSAYIEGLANLYELDCGPLSGWMYQVNGWYPNYGSSRYQLQAGDEIQWLYSCDQGRDIGGEYAAGKQ